MSWQAAIVLAVGIASMRVAGMFFIGPVLAKRPLLSHLAELIPPAIIAAVMVQLTMGDGRELVVDARLGAMAAAGVLVWRRAPLIVVVFVAAATAAAIRLIS